LSSCDLLVHNGHVATMLGGGVAFGAVEEAVVAVADGRIAWVGPAAQAPANVVSDPESALDADGGWVTPGLIDAHTHLVFGGDRAREFELRVEGATYEEIARAGGGILSTVEATRAASSEELFGSASLRVGALVGHGVTTIEIKSGYGLDVATELRMLAVARRVADELPVSVSATLLGAHALPPDHADDREGYLDLVCEEMIPRAAAAGLADAVDAFCEGFAFSPTECARVFRAAADNGLPVRLHADQLSDLGGAELAARHGARSADHLEHTSLSGVRALAAAKTTAVVLPGAFYFLRETQRPPVQALREHGVPIAVGTDLNPGSSPIVSPLVAMNMACVLLGLTTEEALAGMTRAAAPVLGMGGVRGVVVPRAHADLAVWAVNHPRELSYWLGANPCRAVVKAGRVVSRRDASQAAGEPRTRSAAKSEAASQKP
jgi:imidazolonepropionase